MTASSPNIWLVLGDKLGDNAQAAKVADCLGMPYTTKRLLPRQKYALGKPFFRISLEHLDMNRSDPLNPPWPDLVITAGRRHAMAALWIKAQNPTTKIVLLGRPRRWIEKFDLVITPPQHQVPDQPNVLPLSLPLMRADKERISQQSEHWRNRFDSLKKPIIAVLVGGPTRPYRFDKKAVRELLTQCKLIQECHGGTLYFSTSRRTPAAVIATLDKERPQPSVLHEWTPGDPENPYLALLGLAEYFIVTGDSVSMMIEVADCKKPLAIFPLPNGWRGTLWQRCRLFDKIYQRLGNQLYKTGIVGFGRDLGTLHKMLINTGFAVAAGNAFIQPTQSLPDELEKIGARIRLLIKNPAECDT
ncbi:hypothetical protein MNBD_GAMMA13-2046 [hydrothermal vent metagenome]|uniref:DUF1022 domain-containing protein n=1 Tax=hydrothermal vent metagenome TaxID=652676 RepID=A0A3B0YG88_9ZZZZ